MGLTLCFSGSATDWTAGDLSSGILAGSTHAILSIKNTSDVPVKFYFRQTGTADEENRDITPGESKQITVALTAARTIEHKVEGGGSISCYVVTAFGSGLYLTTVTVADIRTLLLSSAFEDVSETTQTVNPKQAHLITMTVHIAKKTCMIYFVKITICKEIPRKFQIRIDFDSINAK